MKPARFSAQGEVKHGVASGDEVTEICGNMFEKYTLTKVRYRLAHVKLLAPVQSLQSFGRGDTILIAYDSPNQGVEHEGECVAVIGKRCRRVSPDEAWSYILGYTCGNDVSERFWQENDLCTGEYACHEGDPCDLE